MPLRLTDWEAAAPCCLTAKDRPALRLAVCPATAPHSPPIPPIPHPPPPQKNNQYPESSSNEGSYFDPEVSRIIVEHNTKARMKDAGELPSNFVEVLATPAPAADGAIVRSLGTVDNSGSRVVEARPVSESAARRQRGWMSFFGGRRL